MDYNMQHISNYLTDMDGGYTYSKFNDQNYDKFFLNDFLHYQKPHLKKPGVVQKGFSPTIDINGEYIHNSFGYRGPEFHSNTQAIFAGDSFTYGVGIPEDGIWSSIVSKSLNLDSVNMGWPGASVTGIVGNLMHYFKKYGNPEYLFCMFPEFARMQVFLNNNILVSSSSYSDGFQEVQLSHLLDYNERPKYAKKPFMLEDIFANEIAHYYSLKSIQMLEQYCDAAGIKFLWSMFHEPDHRGIKKLADNEYGYYNHFIDTKQDHWLKDKDSNDIVRTDGNSTTILDCHKDQQDVFGERFFLGGDTELGRERAHFGVHRHIHTAEVFIEKVQRLNEDSRNK